MIILVIMQAVMGLKLTINHFETNLIRVTITSKILKFDKILALNSNKIVISNISKVSSKRTTSLKYSPGVRTDLAN